MMLPLKLMLMETEVAQVVIYEEISAGFRMIRSILQ